MSTPARKSTSRKPAAPKAAAAAAEAKHEPIVFEFKGLTYEVPTDPREFPLAVLQTDDELVATSLVLGEDQWAAFVATNPSVGDFYDLVEAMSEARGRDADAGN
jgi:hypothetical protein